MGEYSKALSYYEKALKLNNNHFLRIILIWLCPVTTTSVVVYENMGEYSKARSFYKRAVNIAQQSLPSNHPDLQRYRNNLDRYKKEIVMTILFFFVEEEK